MVSIINNPPEKPILNGPSSGQKGVEYSFNVSTIDPEGDSVFFLFDWYTEAETSWQGPYQSEEEYSANHIFSEDGTYMIKVKAKDTYDEESEWSEPLQIRMSRNKAINIPFLLFLENHPYMFIFLRHVINLKGS